MEVSFICGLYTAGLQEGEELFLLVFTIYKHEHRH